MKNNQLIYQSVVSWKTLNFKASLDFPGKAFYVYDIGLRNDRPFKLQRYYINSSTHANFRSMYWGEGCTINFQCTHKIRTVIRPRDIFCIIIRKKKAIFPTLFSIFKNHHHRHFQYPSHLIMIRFLFSSLLIP